MLVLGCMSVAHHECIFVYPLPVHMLGLVGLQSRPTTGLWVLCAFGPPLQADEVQLNWTGLGWDLAGQACNTGIRRTLRGPLK